MITFNQWIVNENSKHACTCECKPCKEDKDCKKCSCEDCKCKHCNCGNK